MKHRYIIAYVLLGLWVGLLVACGVRPEATPEPAPVESPTAPSAPPTAAAVSEVIEPPPAGQTTTIQTEASRDGVFTLRSGQRQTLPAPRQTDLAVGDGVDVDENGRAILRFADLLTVELLRNGELQLQELAADQQSALVTIQQINGVLLNDFNPEKEINRRLTVQSQFAVITATGTRFVVVREANSPLEWIVGLDAAEGDLAVTADGTTKPVSSGVARWIAPIGEPSAGIPAKMPDVGQWIEGLRQGTAQREIGEVVWDPADVVADTSPLAQLPQPGDIFDLENNVQGAVQLSLDPQGLFGNPTYTLADCNGDEVQDLVIQAGKLLFDFRPVLARVRALDVTVINRDQPGNGSLVVLDPARAEINNQPLTAGPGQGQILSLRSNQPYHYAELSMADGCFLGFSLTPPTAAGEPGQPRPAVEKWQGQASVTPPGAAPFVRIDQPADGSDNTRNGFVLSGESSVPFERNLTVQVETADGRLIQREPLYVEGGEPGGAPGSFKTEITVDYNLPADIRVRVQQISAKDGSVVAEDTVLLKPLLPAEGGNVGPTERPPENGQMQALPVDRTGYGAGIDIDGSPDDWDALARLSQVDWTAFRTVVYDQNCAARYPAAAAGSSTDLAGQVRFAYDSNFLYVAFNVADDGYVAYSGADERFFRGDAPQLLLDLDLAGDYAVRQVNEDDVQVDFQPGLRGPGFAPKVALWQLASLTARDFTEARVAASQAKQGYFLEAALPWKYLAVNPQPGLRLGMAASVSDNDTPGTDSQECMISTAPKRDWQDPATWGTLVLEEK